MSTKNYSTTLDYLVQLKKQLYFLPKRQKIPQENLKILLKQRQLTAAIDFLEKRGLRRESILKIFSKLRNTSFDLGGAA